MGKIRLLLVLFVLSMLAFVNTHGVANAPSAADSPFVTVLHPNGGETLHAGSICEIKFSYFYSHESDMDTMNDTIDPFPCDFNNDGIPDGSTWGIHWNGYGPDVDGDGRTDYPYGNRPWYRQDLWLNTTIPHHPPFPPVYWDKPISVYIGILSTVTRLTLEFSSNGVHGNFSQIYDSKNYLGLLNRTYNWTVPDLESSNCYIHATLYYNNTIYNDTSDSAFSIVKAPTDPLPFIFGVLIVIIVLAIVFVAVWKYSEVQ